MPFTITYKVYDHDLGTFVNRVHDYQPATRDEAVTVARHLSLDFSNTYVHVLEPSGWPAYRFINGLTA
jgi:hypothetical protein